MHRIRDEGENEGRRRRRRGRQVAGKEGQAGKALSTHRPMLLLSRMKDAQRRS